jgi:hypothetical protein
MARENFKEFLFYLLLPCLLVLFSLLPKRTHSE